MSSRSVFQEGGFSCGQYADEAQRAVDDVLGFE
jgi:hypothetical protein